MSILVGYTYLPSSTGDVGLLMHQLMTSNFRIMNLRIAKMRYIQTRDPYGSLAVKPIIYNDQFNVITCVFRTFVSAPL